MAGAVDKVVSGRVSVPQGSDGQTVPDELCTTSEPANASAVLRAARSGDEEAFRVLYRHVQPGLLRYLRVLVGEDAEDVASEAWLQIARDLRRFTGELDGFRGWAATIARNRALDLLRQRRRRPLATAPVEQLIDLPAREDTAGSAVSAIGTDSALSLIARLPRDQAEAVLLRAVVGLDAAGAAKVLDKRPGAVRTAAHRGLRKLAALLADQPTGRPQSRSSGRGVTETSAPALKEVR